MFQEAKRKAMIWYYKRKARRLLWKRERLLEGYDCGYTLAYYVSSGVFHLTQVMFEAANKARALEGLPPFEGHY